MKKRIVTVFAILIVITAFAAYAGHPESSPKPFPYESAMKHMPWAAGGDLRYHITIHKPYTKWDKWPGKGEKYAGKEPHGSFLTTYVNDIALDSIKKAAGMADSSMIVKENYDGNKQLAAVTVMYKIKGYSPDGNDWFWAKYDPEFNILAEGKVDACLKCHAKEKDNDYIFTGKVMGK